MPKGFYSSEFYTSKLIEYLDECPADQPFFGYLAFTAPHDPLHAPDEWVDKYKGKYNALLQTRLKRLKDLGIIAPDAKPFPRLQNIPAWEKLTDDQKKLEARKMEVYAAMIANVDHHLGRLFGHLKKSGKWKNTLIIFLSDNGANGLHMHQYPETNEAWIERYSDNRFENLGPQYSRIATGPAWAQVSMTPFRLFKMFVAEGGIRSPMIMAGPGVENAGTRNGAFSHVMDVAATILEVAKTSHPGTSYKGRKVEPKLRAEMIELWNTYSRETGVTLPSKNIFEN